MGFWFNRDRKDKAFRTTPTKIGKKWYTPKGEEVKNPDKYFKTVEKRGRFWEGKTGWNKKKKD